MIRWLLSTRVGRWLFIAFSMVSVVALAYLRGKSEGRKQEEIQHVRRRVEAMREANEVRDDVESRSDSDVRDDLSRWMRDND